VEILGGHPFYLQLFGEELTRNPTPYGTGALKQCLQSLLFSPTGRLSLFFEAEYRKAVGRSTFLAGVLAMPLLAALFPRTYLDPNRHAGDIDLDLLDGPWPDAHVPSGKARIGKALVWRTLDDGRPIYDRKLTVQELRQRIARCHAPYHQALRGLLDAAHARHGVVYHLNCHSMNAVSGTMGEGGAGRPRADMVLGDRDGTTCAPAFTAFVREVLTAQGYDVAVNDPFKGVELVRAHADPAAGRHSLQLEVNKRLYMDQATLQKHAGFARLQADLMALLDAISQRFAPA